METVKLYCDGENKYLIRRILELCKQIETSEEAIILLNSQYRMSITIQGDNKNILNYPIMDNNKITELKESLILSETAIITKCKEELQSFKINK